MDLTSIRNIEPRDLGSIVDIYNHYVLNTVVSFEESIVTTQEMMSRVEEIQAVGLPWLVVEENSQVLGFAYASKWKGRCAYRRSAETTIYLDRNTVGRGRGSALYGALILQLRELDYHTAIGGIALPNAASVALHQRIGFKQVALFQQVGFKHNRWVDVGYWQLML